MKTARAPAIAVIVAVLLLVALFDPEPRRVTTVAPSSVNQIAPASFSTAAAKSDVWFCAGGTAVTDGFADHKVLLINTTDVERIASISAVGSRVLPSSRGPTGERSVTLPPYARSELRLADLVPNAAYASATVELSGGGVVVEHSITGPTGFDRAPCASSASAEWFVPLSATATEKNPTARAVLVLYNPFADNAVLDINFVTDAASTAAPIESMVVAPGSVEVVDLTAVVPVANQVASAIRARAGRVVVDRIEAFDDASARRDLVLTAGVPAAAPTWFLPSGRLAPPRQERLVVYNPSEERAEVIVEVRPDDRLLTIEPFSLQVGAGRFAILDLSAEKRLSDAGVTGYSVIVRSTGPAVAVDRLVTVPPGQPGAGASSTTGAALASPTVVIDGAAASVTDPSELIVFNPNARAIASVRFEVIANGQRQPAKAGTEFELQPGERTSLPFAQLGIGNFTVIITASAPVVAERESASNNVRSAEMGIPDRATAQIPKPITLELGE